MPTVPTYGDPRARPEALPTPFNGARPGPDAFGGQLGAGLEAAGGQLRQYAEQEQKKQDAAAVMDASATLAKARQAAVDQALQKKGKDAVGIEDATLADFDSTAAAISDGMRNEDQERAFAARAQAERDELSRQVATHERQQADVAAQDAYEAVLSTSVSDGANNPTDPISLAKAQASGRLAVVARAKAAGWSPEVFEQQLRSFDSALHMSVAERLIGMGDGAGAQAYLKAHGAEIDGALRARSDVDRAALAAGVVQQSLTTARDIQGKAQDLDKQLELARQLPNAQLQDATVQRLLHDQEAQQHARDAANRERLGQIIQMQEEGDATWKYSPQFALLDDQHKAIAEERYATILRQKRSLQNEDRRLAADARREQAEQNKLAVQQFLSLPVEQQAALPDLKAVFPGADPLGLAELGNHQRRAKDDVDKKLIPDRTQFDDAVRQANADAGLDPKAPDARANVVYMNLWREAWYREHAGKGPTRDDVAKALSEKMLQVKVKDTGTIFDDSTSLLEARSNPKYSGKQLEPKFGDDQVAAARATLQARGRAADDAAVDRYLRAKFGLPVPAAPAPAAPIQTGPIVPGIP